MIKKIGYIIIAILAMAIGLYPLMYFILDRTFGLLGNKSEALLADVFWNTGFYAHILFGGLALFVGWIQFSKKIRNKRLKLHRQIGLVYFIAAMISSIAGIYIGFYATGGPIAMAGFIILGLIWFSTTLAAFLAIKNKNLAKHQQLMIYSYAACFAAVTLRIWLPLLIMWHQGDFIPAYRIVAWLCWVPNIIVAFIIVKALKPVTGPLTGGV